MHGRQRLLLLIMMCRIWWALVCTSTKLFLQFQHWSPPRAISSLFISQPRSSHPSTRDPRKGTASFGSPHCSRFYLLQSYSMQLGKIKRHWYSAFLESPAKPHLAQGRWLRERDSMLVLAVIKAPYLKGGRLFLEALFNYPSSILLQG